MAPPEADTVPMPVPPSDDEPLDLQNDQEEERTTVTTTDDLLGTPQGERPDDPTDSGKTG